MTSVDGLSWSASVPDLPRLRALDRKVDVLERLQATDVCREYCVSLRCGLGAEPLGLELAWPPPTREELALAEALGEEDLSGPDAGLAVAAVRGGLVERHNELQPRFPVRPGDRLVEVNGYRIPWLMRSQVLSAQGVLRLTLRRGGGASAGAAGREPAAEAELSAPVDVQAQENESHDEAVLSPGEATRSPAKSELWDGQELSPQIGHEKSEMWDGQDLSPKSGTRALPGETAELPPPIRQLSDAAEAAEPAIAQLSDAEIQKVHSAVRWGKSTTEVEAAIADCGGSVERALAAVDPKNGNLVLHIAAQNNHVDLTRYLLEKKADVNAQNGKGQTALHMTVAYDMYDLTKMLLEEFGARQDVANGDGHAAITGIDGDKVNGEAWDAPLNLMAGCTTKVDLDAALAKLEGWPDKAGTLDKAKLIQTGMANKKRVGANWDHARFMAVMKTF